ncbi:HIT family protein [Halalkalibacterium halodurans]|jgi:histidine triad (HIT) family protein|uniref:Hit-like protein involved in cell-cycle regulation n=2 Tax=Halalkalibacterium halodurans TaxID=86665 RepID=Q9KDM3_HALH5|nr:HIT family protein [Halalkalibacterium halodurans]MDY7221713.1 HIT family protein [Halalkalibacterium halodurans]MDY7240989.1 HIT family protein [Halalkalibacterium halodurans]MED3648846.1 HIT family protein [Halalkalibacterium halodurans]MED4079387.1 HIT family protein [Halalkalibacterium halodurans]MED4085458.1 HIT family protein [Halalkalibacterium halodurans]
MSHDPNCIFCKIIAGEIPSATVYEDDHVYAFLDISQVTKGHTLVIPKVHKRNVFELSEEIASSLFAAVPKISRAINDAFQPIGMNIVNNNGEAAGQTVFHYHLHLLPRYGEGDGYGAVWKDHSSQYSGDDLQVLSSSIREHL